MRVALPSDGEGLESEISEHFGKAKYFLILDLEDGKIKSLVSYRNDKRTCMRPVHLIKESKVNVVIVKNIGLNPYTKLKMKNIKIYRAEGKVSDAINRLLSGELKEFREEDLHKH